MILLAIGEQMGMSNTAIGYTYMGITIGLYAVIGISSRTAQISEYYVAGRSVPGALQRHGDRLGLDERRVVHRHGRHDLRPRL